MKKVNDQLNLQFEFNGLVDKLPELVARIKSDVLASAKRISFM